jgi:hypothetical protein
MITHSHEETSKSARDMANAPGDAPHPGKMLDMVMLVVVGGMERTETICGAPEQGWIPAEQHDTYQLSSQHR